MKKLKIGFADTHEHLMQFFYTLLANRFDVELDNDNPDYLIFGMIVITQLPLTTTIVIGIIECHCL